MSIEQPLIKGKRTQATPVSPVGIALARDVKSTLSSTVEITLHDDTTWIRVYAISKDVYLKWGDVDCEASNFDEVIIAGKFLDFEVPRKDGKDRYDYLNIIERESAAKAILIQK